MHNARLIIFLVDKAWLLSRNCFEELAWAQGKLCTKHNEWPYRLDMCDYEEREFESKPFVDAPAPLCIVAFLGQEALSTGAVRAELAPSIPCKAMATQVGSACPWLALKRCPATS